MRGGWLLQNCVLDENACVAAELNGTPALVLVKRINKATLAIQVSTGDKATYLNLFANKAPAKREPMTETAQTNGLELET